MNALKLIATRGDGTGSPEMALYFGNCRDEDNRHQGICKDVWNCVIPQG